MLNSKSIVSRANRNRLAYRRLAERLAKEMSISAIFLALMLMLGCSECEVDYDCPGTQICNASSQICERFVCREDAQCPPGHQCQNNRCVQSQSKSPPDAVDDFVVD
jgi:hypothetical protein